MSKVKTLIEKIRLYNDGLTGEERDFIRKKSINRNYPVAVVGIPDLQLALQVRKKLPDMAIILKNGIQSEALQ